MSTPVSPSRLNASALRRAAWPGSDMRIGDTERAQVADRLGKHFSDGRLDEAEFHERLDRAMRAKTMGDLTGLLSDLPETEPIPVPVPPNGNPRHQRRMLKIQLERERLRLQHERRERRRAERHRRLASLAWVPVLAAIVIVSLVVVHTLMHSIAIWIVIGVVALLWIWNRSTGGDQDS